MEQVYVLELRGGCWYVGKTTDVPRRVEEHRSGRGAGAQWTRLHPVVGLAWQSPLTSAADSAGLETRMTAQWMLERGVQRVRGAGLCHARDYTVADAEMLVSTIGHALGLAYGDVRELVTPELSQCGTVGRAAAPLRTGPTQWECSDCGRTFQNELAGLRHECLGDVTASAAVRSAVEAPLTPPSRTHSGWRLLPMRPHWPLGQRVLCQYRRARPSYRRTCSVRGRRKRSRVAARAVAVTACGSAPVA
jgi:predicted GIY-YIG superfamily endonuclease